MTDETSAEERRALVRRICESSQFRKSPRLQTFLQFITEQTLLGGAYGASEQEIGLRVFERKPDFDPSEDSIVRTSARQLRTKLKEYFEEEGAGEELRLEVPKGAYAPIFTRRELAAEAVTTALPPAPAGNRSRLVFALAALCGILAVTLGIVGWRLASVTRDTAERRNNVLAAVLQPGGEHVQLVVADFSFVMMQNIAHRTYSLTEYASRAYVQPAPSNAVSEIWDRLASRYIVSFGEASAALALYRGAGSEAPRIQFRHTRELSARDFRRGSYILFGSTTSNPWTQLFEDRLGFRYVPDAGARSNAFRDVRAATGSRDLYALSEPHRNTGAGYARVALLPNLSGEGKVLIVTGLNMVTLEAAAEMLAGSGSAAFLSALGVQDWSALPDFEALLEVNTFDYAPRNPKVVVCRRVEASRAGNAR